MKIFVTMKSLAKRKNFLTKKEIHLPRKPSTLRKLLEELVELEIQQFNNKQPDLNLAAFLTREEMELQARVGKVGFSNIYHEEKVSLQMAVQTAIQGFEDGLYKVFQNEQELTELAEDLTLHDGEELTFIKLTMLAGRMW